MKSLYRKVESFDGQTITINGKPSYELGSFLGGGAAGVVYEVGNKNSTCLLLLPYVTLLNTRTSLLLFVCTSTKRTYYYTVL